MRDIRKGNCPCCQHHEIVEALQPDFADGGLEVASAVTAEPRWLIAGRNPSRPYGFLRTYFCRACGFAQEFVDAPATVPIGPQWKTRIIEGVTSEGPFR